MSQKEQIKQYLLTGKTLSPLEALQKFGCFRLGARIWDLRHEGYQIENIGADDGQYAVYKMKMGDCDCGVKPEGHTHPSPSVVRFSKAPDAISYPVKLPPAFDPKPTQNQPSLL